MGLRTKCPHCGHELDLKLNMTKTADDQASSPIAASILRANIKGPLYAVLGAIMIFFGHVILF